MSGARIVPPSVAAMQTSAHRRGSPPGIQCPSTHPSPAPSISSGASYATRRAGRERDRPDDELHQQQRSDDRQRKMVGEQIPDDVVAHAERTRLEDSHRCPTTSPPSAGHHIQ